MSRAQRLLSLLGQPSRWPTAVRSRLPRRSADDWFLRRSRGVIHVGANYGNERRDYSRHDLKVIWIEPIPDVFQGLLENLRAFPKQQAYQRLITDEDGTVCTLHVSSNAGQSSSILPLGLHSQMFPKVSYVGDTRMSSTTLDTFCDEAKIALADYDCLVLDTQGSELMALQGATQTLQGMRFVKVEAADFESYMGCPRASDIDEFLLPLGFEIAERREFARKEEIGAYYDTIYRRPGTRRFRRKSGFVVSPADSALQLRHRGCG